VVVTTLAVLGLGAAVYAGGVTRCRGRWPRWRTAAAAGGTLVLVGALLPPLDEWAEGSLTAHMVQHALLIVVAAPLLAAAQPMTMLSVALAPARLPRWLRRAPPAGVACALHAAAVWLWHLPAPYELTLRSAVAHAGAHASLLSTAVLLCWSVSRGRARLAGALWLFVTALHAGALGALLALSSHPWFPSHPSLIDQEVAGLVMWIPGGIGLSVLALTNLGIYLCDLTNESYRPAQRLIELDHVPPAAMHDDSVVNRERSVDGLADGCRELEPPSLGAELDPLPDELLDPGAAPLDESYHWSRRRLRPFQYRRPRRCRRSPPSPCRPRIPNRSRRCRCRPCPNCLHPPPRPHHRQHRPRPEQAPARTRRP
jgi:putative membrane protein